MSTHNCGCGEGDGHHHTLTVSLDGENNVACNIIGIFGVADADYIALQPEDSTAVMIFKYAEERDGGVRLGNIESDEEYKIVLEAFDSMFEEEDDFDYDDFFNDEFDFEDDLYSDDDFDDDDFDDDFVDFDEND